MAVSPLMNLINRYFRRTLRVFTMLVDLHLDIAMQEATQERKRLISSLAMLGVGIFLMTMALILLHIVAVWVAHYLGLTWLEALLVVAAVDLLLGIIFMAAGSRKLRGPYMLQTQARLARTTAALTREE